jgi:hypothetical protein
MGSLYVHCMLEGDKRSVLLPRVDEEEWSC